MVVNYAGKPAPAQAVVAEIKAAGAQGIAVQADMENAEDLADLDSIAEIDIRGKFQSIRNRLEVDLRYLRLLRKQATGRTEKQQEVNSSHYNLRAEQECYGGRILPHWWRGGNTSHTSILDSNKLGGSW